MLPFSRIVRVTAPVALLISEMKPGSDALFAARIMLVDGAYATPSTRFCGTGVVATAVDVVRGVPITTRPVLSRVNAMTLLGLLPASSSLPLPTFVIEMPFGPAMSLLPPAEPAKSPPPIRSTN